MQAHSPLVELALASDREIAAVEFKSSFDPRSSCEWCEIIKDFVAIANSGGGVIVIGLDDHGAPSGADVTPLMALDPAEITDKVNKYTGHQFSAFSLHPCQKDSAQLLAIELGPLPRPLAFEKPGTYDIGDGRQASAFREGTIFFRHGAKSEPCDNNDLAASFDLALENARRSILDNLRQVVEAPVGSTVITLLPSEDEGSLPVRLSDDPSAPVVGRMEPDQTHPYRLRELVATVNKKLPSSTRISPYDIQAVRTVLETDSRLGFHYHSRFSGHQYSEAFANWLVDQHRRDPGIFLSARARYLEIRRRRARAK